MSELIGDYQCDDCGNCEHNPTSQMCSKCRGQLCYMMTDADVTNETIVTLRAENAKLREALEWYADTSNYDEGLAPVIITHIGSWYDHGYKAREALK